MCHFYLFWRDFLFLTGKFPQEEENSYVHIRQGPGAHLERLPGRRITWNLTQLFIPALSAEGLSPQSRLDTKLVCRESLRAWLDAHTEEVQHLLYGLLADHVNQSPFTNYRTYVQKHFAPVLGRPKLRDLTPRELQYFCHFKQKFEGLRPSRASA